MFSCTISCFVQYFKLRKKIFSRSMCVHYKTLLVLFWNVLNWKCYCISEHCCAIFLQENFTHIHRYLNQKYFLGFTGVGFATKVQGMVHGNENPTVLNGWIDENVCVELFKSYFGSWRVYQIVLAVIQLLVFLPFLVRM